MPLVSPRFPGPPYLRFCLTWLWVWRFPWAPQENAVVTIKAYYKGYKWTARLEGTWDKIQTGPERGNLSPHGVRAYYPPSMWSVRQPTWAAFPNLLWRGFISEAGSMRSLADGDWTGSPTSLACPELGGWPWKVQPSSQVLVLLATGLHPEAS